MGNEFFHVIIIFLNAIIYIVLISPPQNQVKVPRRQNWECKTVGCAESRDPCAAQPTVRGRLKCYLRYEQYGKGITKKIIKSYVLVLSKIIEKKRRWILDSSLLWYEDHLKKVVGRQHQHKKNYCVELTLTNARKQALLNSC